MKNEKLVTEISRDFEKIYIDICHSNGLKINLGCISYYNELMKGGFHGMYRYRVSNLLFLYIVRYLKCVRPIMYRNNRKTIMSYYTKQCFSSGHDFVLSLLPFQMLQIWQDCLKKVKI